MLAALERPCSTLSLLPCCLLFPPWKGSELGSGFSGGVAGAPCPLSSPKCRGRRETLPPDSCLHPSRTWDDSPDVSQPEIPHLQRQVPTW